ncbi:hypothetical protein MSPP1_003847 [Malassezia sp. CBS 17886]|nr:hypothetical protein MSPP1_003847 [Malassezia sp. CBS 17886]
MVLMIFVNMSQLTNNMVARNIRMAYLTTNGFDGFVAAAAQGQSVKNVYASNQGAPLATHVGVRHLYAWGLYSYCGGQDDNGARSCSGRSFGHKFQPALAIGNDASKELEPTVNNKLSTTRVQTSDMGRLSRAGMYLLFVGTVILGVAFLVTCLVHMSALVIAGFLTFLGFACVVSGSSIWTYVIHKAISGQPDGIQINYGNALWMAWAATGSSLIAIPALSAGSAVSTHGRNTEYEGY